MSSKIKNYERGRNYLRDYNIRELLDEIDEEFETKGIEPDKIELNLTFLSYINALREGLLEVEGRLDKLEQKLEQNK